MGIYGGREVQTNITKSETLLQSLRQNYILEKKITYHKTKLHYHNTFTSPETNLHFRKQINKTQNTFTSPETNLQMTLTGKGMYQLRDCVCVCVCLCPYVCVWQRAQGSAPCAWH